MGRRTENHCFQIFSYILVSIVFTDGQYESLNLGKKLKTHEVEYGTLLSSIETGPREQLSSKKTVNDSGVILAFAQSGEDTPGGQEDAPVTEVTDSLLATKCTTDSAIVVNPSNLPIDDSDVTEGPIEPTEDPVEPTEDPTEPTGDPEEPTEDPTDDPSDITNNEVDPTATDETEPPTTKAYDGPKKTHVPDHYLDDV